MYNYGKARVMMKPPVTAKIAYALLGIHALFWLGFGTAALLGLHPAMPDSSMWSVVMGVLAIAAAVVFMLMIIFLMKCSKPAYFFSLFFLFVVMLLTFADDFGTSDMIYLAAVLAPGILLIVDRNWYLSREKTH